MSTLFKAFDVRNNWPEVESLTKKSTINESKISSIDCRIKALGDGTGEIRACRIDSDLLPAGQGRPGPVFHWNGAQQGSFPSATAPVKKCRLANDTVTAHIGNQPLGAIGNDLALFAFLQLKLQGDMFGNAEVDLAGVGRGFDVDRREIATPGVRQPDGGACKTHWIALSSIECLSF
jgi:hypothetical protein